jgi:hypothetical protein
LLATRLDNQKLTASTLRRPEDVVRWFGAMQAQDYAGAKWGIGQRVRRCADADVDAAYNSGAILRTHVLRPTWHFVPPEDIRWMLDLTAPRVKRAMSYYDRRLELDAATYRRTNSVIVKALRGGDHLTRADVGRALSDAGVVAQGQRLAHILMRAELDALICSGAMRGKQHTYALLETRAPHTRKIARGDARAELTLRYFAGHGPALAQDFAWWSGLTVAEANRGIEIVRERLEPTAIANKTYWSIGNTNRARLNDPTVHLLPNYDEYLIAFKDHSASHDGPAPGGSAALYDMLSRHVVVLNGRVIGGWRSMIEGHAVIVEPRLMRALDGAQSEALRAAAERYASFVGRPVHVRDS